MIADQQRGFLVEPKQKPVRSGLVRVYCAGKIAKRDWRHEFFPGLSDAQIAWGATPTYPVADVPPPYINDGLIEYGGPFFAEGDGHGTPHGRSTHGAGMLYGECMTPMNRLDLVWNCRSWIDASDLMFVWLDSTTAYGTVAEVGYAIARGLEVYLYEPEDMDDVQRKDMWFVRQLACPVADTAEHVSDAWGKFRRVAERFQRFPVADEPESASPGYVYLIRTEEGEYKIGRSKNPSDRLNLFKVKLPFKWELVHLIPCQDMFRAEGILHRMFIRRRVNGEWFILSESEVAMITSISSMA